MYKSLAIESFFIILEFEIFGEDEIEMKRLLLAVFVTLIIAISLFGYFYDENQTTELIDSANEN